MFSLKLVNRPVGDEILLACPQNINEIFNLSESKYLFNWLMLKVQLNLQIYIAISSMNASSRSEEI